MLIGAPWDNTGQFHAGSAYLFNAGGTLLTTIHNPAPAASAGEDSFGGAVAALGSDLLVIGAPEDDTGAQDAGLAGCEIARQAGRMPRPQFRRHEDLRELPA